MSHNAYLVRIKWIVILSITMMLDVLPFPVIGFIILFIIIFRPVWFRNAVLEIYDIKRFFNKDDLDAG